MRIHFCLGIIIMIEVLICQYYHVRLWVLRKVQTLYKYRGAPGEIHKANLLARLLGEVTLHMLAMIPALEYLPIRKLQTYRKSINRHMRSGNFFG